MAAVRMRQTSSGVNGTISCSAGFGFATLAAGLTRMISVRTAASRALERTSLIFLALPADTPSLVRSAKNCCTSVGLRVPSLWPPSRGQNWAEKNSY